MIEIDGLELRRGTKVLLENTDLRVNPGERLALIGANGSGKTSLFRLLSGELEPDNGSCGIPADWRLSHMEQELQPGDMTALEFVLDGHRELRDVQAQLDSCEDDNRLAELLGRMDDLRAWEQNSIAERMLKGLGFEDEDTDRKVSDFSGGWQVRLNLARALIRPSELLLLDEPTNHLDVDAVIWLEGWLQQYPGTLVLISHDRDFIDSCCQAVVHLEHRTLFRYSGNYSAFERQRIERLAQQQQAYEKQQRERAHMEDFVRRFRAKATKARQAQSRIKALSRMAELAPAHIDSPFSFSFYAPAKMSDPLLNMRDASLGYSDTTVLQGVKLALHPGSRLGLLGANGRGKSTLLKSLAGDLSLLSGERQAGTNLDIGYFSQHQLEALDLDASPIVQLQRLKPAAREQEIRNFLGSFNFRDTMADSHCRHFSGGEKARLALAIIVWLRPNLLLLDEPTNHLDLDMCHALTVALQAFEGAVVVVSHDRHLLRNTVDDFLLVDSGKVSEFNGDIEDYRAFLLSGDAPAPAKAEVHAPLTEVKRSDQRKQAAAQRAQQAPLRKAIKRNEERTGRKTARLKEIEALLSDDSFYSADKSGDLQDLIREQAELRQLVGSLEEEWLELSDQLETAG